MSDILIRPILTEKVNADSEKNNRFGFVVREKANKVEIRKAVEKLYGVSVKDVNTMRYGGKTKSRNTKSSVVTGKTNIYKKAMITLKEGEIIDFFGNV